MEELCKEWGPKLKSLTGEHMAQCLHWASVSGASESGILAHTVSCKHWPIGGKLGNGGGDEVGSEELRRLLVPHPGPP